MKKNKKFSETEKDIFKLGRLQGQAETKELMKIRMKKQAAYLLYWLEIYKTACHAMSKEIRHQDRREHGIFIEIKLLNQILPLVQNDKKLHANIMQNIKNKTEMNPELLDALNQMRKKR